MSKVNEVLDQLKLDLQSIASFNGKTVHVMSEDTFFKGLTGSVPPLLGIMYEGTKARIDKDKPSHRVGLMGDLGVALILVMQSKSPVGGDLRGTAIEYLDVIRNRLKDTTSPAGHFWRFVVEAPAMEKDGYTLWIQRWNTPVPLT